MNLEKMYNDRHLDLWRNGKLFPRDSMEILDFKLDNENRKFKKFHTIFNKTISPLTFKQTKVNAQLKEKKSFESQRKIVNFNQHRMLTNKSTINERSETYNQINMNIIEQRKRLTMSRQRHSKANILLNSFIKKHTVI
jgi:hypothetical protein